jgi:nucleoside-diphosphate-sugar epimerase
MLVHAPSPEKGVKIDEDWPLDPPWAYPKSKAQTEALIRQRSGGMKSVILRFAGVYDEYCRAAFIAQQIARMFERLPTAYLFTGDITHGQPYLHRDDLADAVVQVVDRRAELPDETTLLIGEEETPSYQEMQQRPGLGSGRTGSGPICWEMSKSALSSPHPASASRTAQLAARAARRECRRSTMSVMVAHPHSARRASRCVIRVSRATAEGDGKPP